MSLRLRIGIVYHLYRTVRMRGALRDRLALNDRTKIAQAVLADVTQHQSTVPCSAPALNSGVMPAEMEREADSEPE